MVKSKSYWDIFLERRRRKEEGRDEIIGRKGYREKGMDEERPPERQGEERRGRVGVVPRSSLLKLQDNSLIWF